MWFLANLAMPGSGNPSRRSSYQLVFIMLYIDVSLLSCPSYEFYAFTMSLQIDECSAITISISWSIKIRKTAV